jgi:hypothetical protein
MSALSARDEALLTASQVSRTGDRRHLLPLGTFRGTEIISAAEFLALIPAP